MALPFCLLMLVMLIMLIRSLVANAYLSGNGLSSPAAQLLAAVSDRSGDGPPGVPDHGCARCFLPGQ